MIDISHKNPGSYENTRFEKIHNVIFDNSLDGSIAVANEIAELIKKKQLENKNCILGLATGSSPIKVYEELIRLHREENLSFENVITFNLDEYFPMSKQDNHSYFHFMNEYLFNHIDIPKENVNIPNGSISKSEVLEFCKNYEDKIDSLGGLDFQLLGIGRTGHVGFNEPGSHYNSATRIINLDYLTMYDASDAFGGMQTVPKRAITMGISTILKAKRIVLMSWGDKKSSIVAKTIEGNISSEIPATYLQNHKNTTFVLDRESSLELSRIKTPWVVESCNWDESLIKKAVIWLSQKLNKPILKLTERNYNDNYLADLLILKGSAYKLNIEIFNKLQHTITGWPGGKPNSDDSQRPERAFPKSKKVMIFSPHPDDDVISMGGTFLRLIEQGHDVHVVYQTSGNIAVSDDEALKFAEVSGDILGDNTLLESIKNDIKNKQNNNPDTLLVRKLKSSIRRRECYGATRFYGLSDDNVHFLNLPFYETGAIKKSPISDIDIEIVSDIIKQIKPHQIYAAGDLADPHGTHKVCLDAIFESLKILKTESYMKDCWLWLYRGAWHEWGVDEIEMAVPLSPKEVGLKRKAIFYHQSQKDGVMFQGNDNREFWQRAEDRNKKTANIYRDLGFASYEAMEAFKRWDY